MIPLQLYYLYKYHHNWIMPAMEEQLARDEAALQRERQSLINERLCICSGTMDVGMGYTTFTLTART